MMVRRQHIGLGVASQANAYAGTYDDINCPTSCFVLGNVLDTAILGAECWPCHNVCPPGTVWDTAVEACSSNPAVPNPVTPTTQDETPAPAPSTCTSWWDRYFNSQCGGSTTFLLIGGGLVAVVAVAIAFRR